MKNRFTLIIIGIWLIVACLAIITVNTSYGTLRLKNFNELNNTHYTMKQWRVYEYEIRKLHPFTNQGAN